MSHYDPQILLQSRRFDDPDTVIDVSLQQKRDWPHHWNTNADCCCCHSRGFIQSSSRQAGFSPQGFCTTHYNGWNIPYACEHCEYFSNSFKNWIQRFRDGTHIVAVDKDIVAMVNKAREAIRKEWDARGPLHQFKINAAASTTTSSTSSEPRVPIPPGMVAAPPTPSAGGVAIQKAPPPTLPPNHSTTRNPAQSSPAPAPVQQPSPLEAALPAPTQHSQSTTAVTNNVSLTVTGRVQDPSGESDQTTLTRILATVQAIELRSQAIDLRLQRLEHQVSEIHALVQDG